MKNIKHKVLIMAMAALFSSVSSMSHAQGEVCNASLELRGYDWWEPTAGPWLIRTSNTLTTSSNIKGTNSTVFVGDTGRRKARDAIYNCWVNQFPATGSSSSFAPSCTNVVWPSGLGSLALANIAQGLPASYNCNSGDIHCYAGYPNIPITHMKTTLRITGGAGCEYTDTRYLGLSVYAP